MGEVWIEVVYIVCGRYGSFVGVNVFLYLDCFTWIGFIEMFRVVFLVSKVGYVLELCLFCEILIFLIEIELLIFLYWIIENESFVFLVGVGEFVIVFRI